MLALIAWLAVIGVVVWVGNRLAQHGHITRSQLHARPKALRDQHAVRSGQVKKGETLLLEGVGGGFTWGAVLLKL